MTATTRAGTDMQVRQFQIRSVDAEDRTVTGVAVPFNTEVRINDWLGHYFEQIAPGACEVREGEPKLFWQHQEIIGRVTDHADTEDGWQITARISDTTAGNDAYALLKDGAIDRFSIGFVPIEHTTREDEDGIEHITRTRIEVREVSLVPFPAYNDAAVTAVRHNTEQENTNMSVTAADLDEVRTSIDVLSRKVETLPTDLAPADQAPVARSIGDLVKRLAAGDEDAIRAYERAWDGSTSADTILHDAWVGSLVEIIKRRRPVLSTFATGALPADGLGVEYAVLKSDTTKVEKQTAEGADLAFGKVAIETASAPVETLGGYSSLSRQAIERANIGILDTMWEALAEKYGQASEARARAVLDAAISATGGQALATVPGDLTTQDGIVAAVLDLAEHFETAGRALDGVFVDKATFLALYGVEATDRVLQVNGAPADKVGTLTVETASGNVAGLQFRLLPNAAANTVLAYDATAIRTLEAPGAPFRLQDGNVVNLTENFSLYGYLASFVQKRDGLVKVTAGSGGGD